MEDGKTVKGNFSLSTHSQQDHHGSPKWFSALFELYLFMIAKLKRIKQTWRCGFKSDDMRHYDVVVEMGNLSSFLLKSNNGFCGFPNRHHRLWTWRRIFVGHSLGFHFSSKYDDYGNSWLHPPHWRVWPPLRSGCRFYVAIERNASAGVALLSGRRYVL